MACCTRGSLALLLLLSCFEHQPVDAWQLMPLPHRSPRTSAPRPCMQEGDTPWYEEGSGVQTIDNATTATVPAAAPAASAEPTTTAESTAADDSAPAAAADGAGEADETEVLVEISDIVNTKWAVLVQPRADGWLDPAEYEAEFTLLEDGSVVWGGPSGGFGTGGRWTLRDETIEIIRTTPLGLITGREYYMCSARATLSKQLQFAFRGVIRSFNALYPVSVIGDFVAVRQPGRFIRNEDDDDDDDEK